jgi:hypothetical protein
VTFRHSRSNVVADCLPRAAASGFATKTITPGTPSSVVIGKKGAYRANRVVLPMLEKKSEDSLNARAEVLQIKDKRWLTGS